MEGRCTKLKSFPFNERRDMKINVPENSYPMFFFGLILTDDFVEDLVKKTNEYADKAINRNRLLCSIRARPCFLKMSISPLLCREKGSSLSCDFSILVKIRSLKMIG